jgi:hypothetical protein
VEQDLSPRSLEVESLAREFLARLPAERIRELAEEFDRVRAIQGRLDSLTLSGSRDELVTYSDVLDERGGIREGVTEHSFFFVFEGREFLVEDHYCANPECDCQEVHLEFWERAHEVHSKRGVTIQQRLMATFTLEGRLKETRFSKESASTTKYLLLAWVRRCRGPIQECRRRYEVIKTIGLRSFPPEPKRRVSAVTNRDARSDEHPLAITSQRQVRRNDPCPCGSGLKFKRCCARRLSATD